MRCLSTHLSLTSVIYLSVGLPACLLFYLSIVGRQLSELQLSKHIKYLLTAYWNHTPLNELYEFASLSHDRKVIVASAGPLKCKRKRKAVVIILFHKK